jgi:predicted RNA-binding protein associated with RNAse of E/G family
VSFSGLTRESRRGILVANSRVKSFKPEQTVLVREIWQGKIWTARPMVLVQDTTELLVLYWVPGTLWKRARNHQGGEISAFDRKMQNWELHDDIWKGEGALRLSVLGAKYSIIIFRNTGNTISNWYINLEYPLTRTDRGFDYIDQILDIIVEPDLKTWHWKDEDEFQDAQDLGIIPPKEANAFRAEGEKVLNLLQSGKSIFNGWEHWKPDPSWRVPILPEGWDII